MDDDDGMYTAEELQAMSAAQEGPVDDPEAELVQAMAMNRRLRELEAKMDAGRAGRKSSTGGGAAGGSKAGARAPSKKTAAASGAAGGAGGGSMRRVQRGTLTPASTAAAAAPPPRPRREDASHTNEELYRIRRSNLVLLRHLEEIQRKGTGSAAGGGAFAKKPVNHTAPSSINRRKELTKIADQNVAFLRRLENVKSTVGPKQRARPGPPGSKKRRSAPAPKLVQPEWQS